MKLKARNSIANVCNEPMVRMEVWIDEIPNGVNTTEQAYYDTYFRGMDTEPAAIAIWAKFALAFATLGSNGGVLPPFQLRTFVNIVQESLRCPNEDDAWIKIPDIF